MGRNRKIKANTPDLLAKYHKDVDMAIKKGVHEALLRHQKLGNSIAVSRNGEALLLRPQEMSTEYSVLDRIWNNDEDDVYEQLMTKKKVK